MEQNSKNQEKRKSGGCNGRKCYRSRDYKKTFWYTYKRDVPRDEPCTPPTAVHEANAANHGDNIVEGFAKTYCLANGEGNENCDYPCECLPKITKWNTKLGETRKIDTRCQSFVEAGAHIECQCSD